MIPDIGFVVVGYVVTRMVELLCPPRTRGARTLLGVCAGVTILVSIISAIDMALHAAALR